MFKKVLIVLMVGCLLLGMATREEAENAVGEVEKVEESVNATEIPANNGELKVELVNKIESVSDYLMSKDGKVLLYAPEATGKIRTSEVKMLNIAEDPKTKVLSFSKIRNSVDIDPEVLGSPWTKLFEDEIIYRDRYPSGDVITKKWDGTILSEIPCDYEVWEPVISPTGKYVAVIPSVVDFQYPSLRIYETETGKKLWEEFIPEDIYYGGSGAPPFYIGASFSTDDSLIVCYNGDIYLFNTKSGINYWRKEIVEDKNVKFSMFWGEMIYITCSDRGDIIFSYPSELNKKEKVGYVYSITSEGNIRWKKRREGVLSCIPKISNFGNYVLFDSPGEFGLLANKVNGELIWKFEGQLLGSRRNICFFTFEDACLVANASIPSDISEKAKDKVCIIDSRSGAFLTILEGTDLYFSNEKKIVMFKNNGILFIYKISKENVK